MRVQPAASGAITQYAVGYLSTEDNTTTTIADSEILGAFSSSTATVASGGNFSGSHVITISSVPTTIYFRGKAAGGSMQFFDDINGRTKITYVKITP
jgi:hypothetical protein